MYSTKFIALSLSLFLCASAELSFAQDHPLSGQSQSELVDVLQSDADTFRKAKACQRLAVIGDEGCTDALVDLLGDPKLSVYALTALQRIPGDRVDAALLYALQAHEGRTRVGIIHTIGQRKVATAEYQLVRLYRSSTATPEEKQAAVRALGALGTVEQISVKDADNSVQRRVTQDAIRQVQGDEPQSDFPKDLASAPKSQFAAALRVMQSSVRDGDQTKFAEQAKSLIDGLAGMSPTRQILAMNALQSGAGWIKDGALQSQIAKLIDASDREVAATAVQLVARTGYYSSAKTLPKWTSQRDDLAKVALPALAHCENDAFDDEVVSRLSDAQNNISSDQRIGLIQYAGGRRLSKASPALLQLAGLSDPEVAGAAIAAAGYTVSPDQFAALLDRIASDSSAAFAAEDADVSMSRALVRLPRDEAASVIATQIDKASDENKIELISLLATLGGDTALETVVNAAASGEDALVDGATRALGEWLSADVASPLYDLLQTLPPSNYRTRALRAYLRVGRQFDMTQDARLELCRRGLQMAERNDERQLVVDILRRNPSADAAKMLVEIANRTEDRPLINRAMSALADVAGKVSVTDPEGLRSVLQNADISAAPDHVREQLEAFLSLSGA